MAQSSTPIKDFEDAFLHPVPNDKEYDRPLGEPMGKMNAYVLMMMIRNVIKIFHNQIIKYTF